MKTMKTIWSVALALTLVACGGQTGKDANGADSTGVAEASDTVAQSVPVAEDQVAEEPVAEEAVLNADLLGKWSNNNDPNIYMRVSDKYGTYDDHKGYGYLSAANEYFETDYTLVFKGVAPEGDRIVVSYDKLEQYFDGDPDDYDSEGQWVTKKVGSGKLTLVPAGARKLKIESGEKRIKGAVLYK